MTSKEIVLASNFFSKIIDLGLQPGDIDWELFRPELRSRREDHLGF